jgi:plasmid stabilization system protein ParE
MTRPELGEGIILIHLRHARGKPPVVRAPRHLLAFRVEGDTVIVLRRPHDAMDLPSRMADLL